MTLIWENQHHFSTMFIWDALKESVKNSNEIVANHREMFESRISSVGAKEKLPESKATGKLDAETMSSWSYDMEGHATKCVKDIAYLRMKRLNNYAKLQHHAWMTINLRKKKRSQ